MNKTFPHNKFIYDIEIFGNYFLAIFLDIETKQTKIIKAFEVIGTEHLQELRTIFRHAKVIVGHNILEYDNHIIEGILAAKKFTRTQTIKNLSNNLINAENKAKYKYLSGICNRNVEWIDTKQITKDYSSSIMGVNIENLCLRMWRPKVITLDKEIFDRNITTEEQGIIEYCLDDVQKTLEVYEYEKKNIEVRKYLLSEVGESFYSSKSSTVVKKYFSKKVCKALNINEKKLSKAQRIVINETKAESLIDNRIAFMLTENQSKLEQIKKETITKDSALAYSFSIADKNYTFGVGGIHSEWKKKFVAKSTPETKIIYADVASLYPQTIINLGISPKGLENVFPNLYKEMLDKRLEGKKNRTFAGVALKLPLNSVTGIFAENVRDENYTLYEPLAHKKICLNAQLLMLMLFEKLEAANFSIIHANTDGFGIVVQADRGNEYYKICSEWEIFCNYKLEHEEIDYFFHDHTNSYALVKNGKLKKSAGTRFNASFDINMNGVISDSSQARIESIAVIDYFVKGITPEKIVQHYVESKDFRAFVFYGTTAKAYSYLSKSATKAKNKSNKDTYKEIQDTTKLDYSDIDTANYLKRIKGAIAEILENPNYLEAIKESYLPLFATCTGNAHNRKENPSETFNPLVQIECAYELENAFKIENLAITSDTAKTDIFDLLLGDNEHYIAHAGTRESLNKVRGYRKYIETNGNHYAKFNGLSWICLNPFEKGTTKRTKESVTARNCITIEYDKMSPEQQWQILKPVPHTAIVYSGGKSLHCHIRFTRPLALEESILIDKYLATLFGESDSSTWRINQYVRVPFGYNYDTKREQLLLSMQNRVKPETFLQWLEEQREKHNLDLSKVTNKEWETGEENEPVVAFYQHVFDNELVVKRKFKRTFNPRTKTTSYVGHCPNAKKHSSGKSNNTEFILHLNADGVIRKFCQHSSCSNMPTLKLWDIGIKLGFYKDNFTKTEQFKNLGIKKAKFKSLFGKTKVNQKLYDLEPIKLDIEKFEREGFDRTQILETLKNIVNGEIINLSMPTGTGKTFLMLLAAKFIVEKQGLRVVFVSSTKNEAYRAVRILKGLGVLPTEMELYCKGETRENEEVKEKINLENTGSKYVITTYNGYWGRKGETCLVYHGFSERIQNAIVMFDECHGMLTKCQVEEQLTSLYEICETEAYLTTDYTIGKKYMICNRKREKLSTDNKRFFPNDFLVKVANDHKIPKSYGIFDKEFVEGKNIISYKQVISTVYAYYLENKDSEKPKQVHYDKSELGYINSLCNDLLNAHLRVELPKNTETQQPVSFYELEKLSSNEKANLDSLKKQFQKPKQTPFVNYLCGLDKLGFWQLCGLSIQAKNGRFKDYARPQAIIFASATMTQEFQDMQNHTLADTFKIRTICNNDIPSKFDVSLLKTTEKISLENVKKICEQILTSDRTERAFVVTRTQLEAEKLGSSLAHYKGVSVFKGNDYIREHIQNRETEQVRVLITYAKSPICKGENLADYQILILACNTYAPLATFTSSTTDQTELKQYKLILSDMTQIGGRLLRTAPSNIKEGETFLDKRKICIVMHSVPEELQNFEIDQSLVFNYQNSFDAWRGYKNIANNTIENIYNVLDGKEIVDFCNKEASELGAKPKNKMSKKERRITDQTLKNEDKNNRRFSQLMNVAISFGDGWRSFFNKNSLHKKNWLTPKMIEELRQVFENK